MYEGYLTLAGVELINNERTAIYARNLGITIINCPPCSMGSLYPYEAYTTPEEDKAEWYDPAVRESGGFAGFYALQVQGFGSSPITRNPIARLGDGSVITRSRYNHREVVYSGVMLAVDQFSLSYGLGWLATALRGSTCGPCGGSDACAYTSCPTQEDEHLKIRTMSQVAVLEGPITNRVATLGRACGSTDQPVIAEVQFTLILGRPWLYGVLWYNTLPNGDFTGCQSGECLEFNGPECSQPHDEFGCPKPGAAGCALDPVRPVNCPEPPAPPSVPRPYDPCGVCYDGPHTQTSALTARRNDASAWFDLVPVVVIRTGARPARAVLIRYYASPIDGSLCELLDLDPCNACGTIAVPYIPANSVLTIDGRDETVGLVCGSDTNRTVLDDSNGIFGPNGRPYDWPVFNCNGFCVTVTVPCDFPTAETQIDLLWASRQDAA